MTEKSSPEAVWVLHKGNDQAATLFICADGKNYHFTLSRRQTFGIMAQASDALKEMEPAEWRPVSATAA